MFPLTVIGMNSIAAYVIAHLFEGFLRDSLNTHLGSAFFKSLAPYDPFVRGALILLIMWLMLLWLYRRRILLKI